MQLLFVNTTNGSRLSREQSRRMRGHVTKAAFSERRRRRAMKGEIPDTVGMPPGCQIMVPSPLRSSPGDPSLPYKLLQSTMVCYWHDPPANSPTQVGWMDFIISEPALFEGTLAANTRHWSPDPASQRRADGHVSRAISLVIDRIQKGSAHTDGILAAVATLAFGESLLRNEAAWQLHMDGLAQVLQDRRSKGLWELPEWFTGLLIMDVMNNVMSFPRVFPANVGEQLHYHGNSELSRVVVIGNRLAQLRHMLENYDERADHQDIPINEIKSTVRELHIAAQFLGSSSSPYVRVTSLAIELYLHFSWPEQPSADLSSLARRLKDALRQLPIKPCPYMDLTSTSFVLGLVAAEDDSETRLWFLSRLRAVVADMESRGWTRPLQHLERAIESDQRLAARFKTIWDDAKDWVPPSDFSYNR